MAATNPVSEQDLEEAFRSDPRFGIALLHEDYRHQIGRYIKSVAWGLSSHDIKDVYSQTMVEMVRAIQSPDFDPSRPLRLVYDIARKRALDALRRRRHRPKTDCDTALQHIAKDLSGTRIGREWRCLDSVTWAEFRQALTESIAILPPKQQIVARVFVHSYEDMRERDIYVPLARGVSEVTGVEENVVTIKKLWHEARKRLAEELTRRGFNFLETEE